MAEPPNVLLILTDQWRADAIGCTGNDDVQTPTIDRLAHRGTMFSRAYTPAPVCTPARGSLLSGMYPHRHRAWFNQLRLPTDIETLGKCFRDAGYETAYVGKWHLDGKESPGYVPPGPRRHGFEYWEGFNSGHNYHKGHPRFTEEGECYWQEGYQPAVQTDLMLDFLEEQHSSDAPFFSFLSWGPPHTPFDAPDEYTAMYDPEALELWPNVPETVRRRPDETPISQSSVREDLAEYYGLITSLDDQLERLLDRLEQLGELDDTIVVFTSDHGEQIGAQGRYFKGVPFEESVRVPLIMRYPPAIDAGRTTDTLANLIDIMPTLLSLCDVPVPDQVQGRDRTPALCSEETASEGETPVYIQGWNPGRLDWYDYEQPWRMIRTERYMLTVDRHLNTQYLYDVEDDPYQMDNRAGQSDVEPELRQQLFDAAQTYDDRRFIVRQFYQA